MNLTTSQTSVFAKKSITFHMPAPALVWRSSGKISEKEAFIKDKKDGRMLWMFFTFMKKVDLCSATIKCDVWIHPPSASSFTLNATILFVFLLSKLYYFQILRCSLFSNVYITQNIKIHGRHMRLLSESTQFALDLPLSTALSFVHGCRIVRLSSSVIEYIRDQLCLISLAFCILVSVWRI